MKLHLTQAAGNQLITGHAPEWVEVNAQRYHSSLLVLPNLLITDWQVTDFDALTAQDFDRIAELAPEVVLLGTGDKHRFIHPRLTAALTTRGIPVECMTTAAACRTYNILMAEDRHVAAALLVSNAQPSA
ncbi:MAG TPA: Mth938-like domain-containing protein [Methylovorus sp.]|nr:Mth938-like domain-containing protein [Methylovorus sp.]